MLGQGTGHTILHRLSYGSTFVQCVYLEGLERGSLSQPLLMTLHPLILTLSIFLGSVPAKTPPTLSTGCISIIQSLLLHAYNALQMHFYIYPGLGVMYQEHLMNWLCPIWSEDIILSHWMWCLAATWHFDFHWQACWMGVVENPRQKVCYFLSLSFCCSHSCLLGISLIKSYLNSPKQWPKQSKPPTLSVAHSENYWSGYATQRPKAGS